MEQTYIVRNHRYRLTQSLDSCLQQYRTERQREYSHLRVDGEPVGNVEDGLVERPALESVGVPEITGHERLQNLPPTLAHMADAPQRDIVQV